MITSTEPPRSEHEGLRGKHDYCQRDFGYLNTNYPVTKQEQKTFVLHALGGYVCVSRAQ